MKKIFYLLFLGLILFSCSNNDGPNEDEIEEKWKLVRAEYLNENNERETVDYTNKNIIFKFLTKGILIIDGEIILDIILVSMIIIFLRNILMESK